MKSVMFETIKRKWRWKKMTVEKTMVVKRTVWTFKCPICDYRKIYAKSPPKELVCPACHVKGHTEWLTPQEDTYTGPDKFDG